MRKITTDRLIMELVDTISQWDDESIVDLFNEVSASQKATFENDSILVSDAVETDSYYADQLAKLNPSKPYAPSVKFWDGQGASTNTMDLNTESIPVLVNYLKRLKGGL